MKVFAAVLSTVLLMAPAIQAQAANTPCSGKMGGVSHCKDGKFVCVIGKISKSKKICS